MTPRLMVFVVLLLGCSCGSEPTVKTRTLSVDEAEKKVPATMGPVTETIVPADLTTHRKEKGDSELRIGYFHGGRNLLLYRALDKGSFKQAKVAVSFWATRSEEDPEFYRIPDTVEEVHAYRSQNKTGFLLGRTTGPQLIEQLVQERLDCAMIGESSFLLMVQDRVEATAIAKLGQDQKDTPGKVVMVRKDLNIKKPSDLIGKRMGSRKGGPYDAVMVREFLEEQGVDPKQLKITDQIPQEKLKKMLKHGKMDVVFLHLNRAAKIIKRGDYELYPNFKFTFANPNLSHSILVCRNDMIKKKRTALVRFLTVYKGRVDYENSLSRDERAPYDGHKTLAMDTTAFEGFNLPQYDPIPLLDPTLLDEMQRLLIKHGYLREEVPFRNHIDMSLMKEALVRAEAEDTRHQKPDTKVDVEQPDIYVGTPSVHRLLRVIDRNGDGKLDQAEVHSAAWDDLSILPFDRDRNGLLDAKELEHLLWKTDPLTPEYRGRQHNLRNLAASESDKEQ